MNTRTPAWRDALLFMTACALGGFGGAFGSILGNAAGKTGLFAGGVIGGLACASLIGPIARSRKWIRAERAGTASIGAALGFLAAALIATQTLSSPIGPALSTLLIGAGALIGAGRQSS